MASDDTTEQYAEAMNEAIASATKAEQQRDDAIATVAYLKDLVLVPSSEVDWRGLYKMNADFAEMLDEGWGFDEIEDHAPFQFFSPRMALRLHDAAIRLTVFPQKTVPVGDSDWYSSGVRSALPPIAQKMANASKPWAKKFQECYPRIANRLANGKWIMPNSTAEEMAFLNILSVAQKVPPDDMLCNNGLADDAQTYFDKLPSYPSDEDFAFVPELAMHDMDVMMLFNPDLVSPALARSNDPNDTMFVCNLEPEEWFVEFQ